MLGGEGGGFGGVEGSIGVVGGRIEGVELERRGGGFVDDVVL